MLGSTSKLSQNHLISAVVRILVMTQNLHWGTCLYALVKPSDPHQWGELQHVPETCEENILSDLVITAIPCANTGDQTWDTEMESKYNLQS